MDAQTVIAVSATIIAIASLTVSIYQLRATRLHNRHSVRPLLQLQLRTVPGERSGIVVANIGLGPAIVTRTRAWLDGHDLGAWSRGTSRQARAGMTPRPRASALFDGTGIPSGDSTFLVGVDAYDPIEHGAFRQLIEQRIEFEIQYESLYGGESYRVTTRTSSWRDDEQFMQDLPQPDSAAAEGPARP
ncbi:hypothetical protein [Nonomuraea sp. SBT364]|uniref:hypothetical protein n=1 Tax=Nonomuraea sp. SBT364 TaxID=1580530 RepID=UPI00066B1650|nr:hypothetical protein [Nonomuraea sp. SBT364]